MNGIAEFFTELNNLSEDGRRIPRAIISSGCYEIGLRVQRDFGVDHVFGNRLIFKNGIVDDFDWPLGAGHHVKADVVRKLCLQYGIIPKEVLFIGDSKVDLEAFKISGVSIAFNDAPEELKEAATHVISSDNLKDVIPVLRTVRT